MYNYTVLLYGTIDTVCKSAALKINWCAGRAGCRGGRAPALCGCGPGVQAYRRGAQGGYRWAARHGCLFETRWPTEAGTASVSSRVTKLGKP